MFFDINFKNACDKLCSFFWLFLIFASIGIVSLSLAHLYVLPIFVKWYDDREYKRGYELAWQRKDKPKRFGSDAESEGWREGVNIREKQDIWMYQSGYYDGLKRKPNKSYNKNLVEYFKNEFYFDGYCQGIIDR